MYLHHAHKFTYFNPNCDVFLNLTKYFWCLIPTKLRPFRSVNHMLGKPSGRRLVQPYETQGARQHVSNWRPGNGWSGMTYSTVNPESAWQKRCRTSQSEDETWWWARVSENKLSLEFRDKWSLKSVITNKLSMTRKSELLQALNSILSAWVDLEKGDALCLKVQQ